MWAVCSANACCCHACLLLVNWTVAPAFAHATACCLIVSAQEPVSLASHYSFVEDQQA